MRRFKSLVLVSGFLCGCGGDPSGPSETSSKARAYLDSALNIMQTWSIKRHEVDWVDFRAVMVSQARGAQTTSDTYGVIRFALQVLGDHHSFFVPPPTINGRLAAGSQTRPPVGFRIDSTAGYIRIPRFSGSSSTLFADEIQGLIREADTIGLCGWIVDLRDNGGGNMWPMLAGVGPILGDGVAGAFVDPDSVSLEWGYERGAAGLIPGSVIAEVSGAPYDLIRGFPSVAVLTNPSTASSGEAIVTAFRGRPDTRSFGQPTSGLSTANRRFGLSDGAVILLTVSTFADRLGRLYGARIFPDEAVYGRGSSGLGSDDDPVVLRSLEWLRMQPGCHGN